MSSTIARFAFAKANECGDKDAKTINNYLKNLFSKIPRPDSFSISFWPPSFGISFSRNAKSKSLHRFEELIDRSKWRKENIGQNEVWVCEDDETFQIVIGDYIDRFSEKWTRVYPDKYGSSKYSVLLYIGGSIIKEMTFIFCDGGRIFVPMPKIETKMGKTMYYWNNNSLEFKIGKIIGDFYIHGSLEEIAKISKIDIR